MKKYIAAIRSEYIRDTQMFDAEGTPIFNEEFEDKWKDTDGHLIVWEGRAEDEKEVLADLHNFYNCPDSAFVIYELA